MMRRDSVDQGLILWKDSVYEGLKLRGSQCNRENDGKGLVFEGSCCGGV